MTTRTVAIADHPDLMTAEEWAAKLGKSTKSLERDARLGVGPPRRRIGNRAYYYRPHCEEYLKQVFEDE